MEYDFKTQDFFTQEDYFKKIHELQVYLDPLKDRFFQLEYKERVKNKKVENLINILSNNKKMCLSYDSLLKCEKALMSQIGTLALCSSGDRDVIVPSRGKVVLSNNMYLSII